jgi:hypothetical protein
MANVIINGIQAEIDNGLSNIVGYNFFKTVFSNHQTIQKKRAEEFLKFIKENEQKFTVELINNECFVSGLALTLREIIKQYSEIKRVRIYSIFLGFVESEDKENFELEKMYHTLNLMSLEDLESLKNFKEIEITDNIEEGKDYKEYDISKISNLISLGLVSPYYIFRESEKTLRGSVHERSGMYEFEGDRLVETLNTYLADNLSNFQEISYVITDFGYKFEEFVFID